MKILDTLKKVHQCAIDVKHAELQSFVAELTNDVTEASLRIASLTEENQDLKNENKRLKERRDNEQPNIKWGCYKFEESGPLYCIKCYNEEGKKSPTSAIPGFRYRQCCVCNNRVACG